jgi:hypothetical protein
MHFKNLYNIWFIFTLSASVEGDEDSGVVCSATCSGTLGSISKNTKRKVMFFEPKNLIS